MFSNKYKNLVIALLIPFFLISFNPALATSNPPIKGGSYNFTNGSGLNTTANKAGYTSKLKNLNPIKTSSIVINTILTFLGIIFIGLIIYGGIFWMTAEGSEEKVEKAKNIITASIIGLIIVIAAYALSYFIIAYFSKQSLSI